MQRDLEVDERRRRLRVAPALVVPWVVCLVLLGNGVSPPVSAQSGSSLGKRIKTQKKELEKVQEEIQAHRKRSKELEKKETSILKRLSALEREIELSGKLLRELERRETLLTEQIDSLKTSITWETGVLAQRRSQLGTRLRQLYKREPHFSWGMLLGSEGVQTMLRRYKFLRLVAERDAKLLREVRERKDALEHEQAVLTEALADVATLKATRSEERTRLKRGKKQRVAMLKRTRNEKTRHVQAIRDLEKAQEELKDLIASLDKKRLEEARRPGGLEGEFAKLKGRLIRPVDGKVIRSFGKNRHPKFGTVTFNSGIDIQAPPGTPVRAVAGGVVEFVDWIAGYGKCIILNHGDGYYTLYAHISEVFVQAGQNISNGEVIAEVGDTGSLNGYVCHFEIRHSKEALNPTAWFAR